MLYALLSLLSTGGKYALIGIQGHYVYSLQ